MASMEDLCKAYPDCAFAVRVVEKTFATFSRDDVEVILQYGSPEVLLKDMLEETTDEQMLRQLATDQFKQYLRAKFGLL